MAVVYCKATGYAQERRMCRGYRMAEDRCEVCRGPVTRRPAHPEPKAGECREHGCYGRGVRLVDLGVTRPRVLNSASVLLGRSYYADYRAWRCPECGAVEERPDRCWSEPLTATA